MSIPAEIKHLDDFISNEQRSIRFYLLNCLGIVILGLVTSVAFFVFTHDSFFKAVSTIAGFFITSLGGFRINNIVNCKTKIDTYRSIKSNWLHARSNTDKERFREMVWKILEKRASG